MLVNALKTEAELRHAVIDRLIAASLRDAKPAREATLALWRTIGARTAEPASNEPNAS